MKRVRNGSELDKDVREKPQPYLRKKSISNIHENVSEYERVNVEGL